MEPETDPKARSERLIFEANRLSEEIDRHLNRTTPGDGDVPADENVDFSLAAGREDYDVTDVIE